MLRLAESSGTPQSSTNTPNWRMPSLYIDSYFSIILSSTPSLLVLKKAVPGWMAQMKLTLLAVATFAMFLIMSCVIMPIFFCSGVMVSG